MEYYQQEFEQIQKLLLENPKGMTVTDISHKLKVNRNSVAKYLDIMRTSGLVEMITFGPAKVFFPSRRVPIINMLNYISDYIVVFDEDLKISLINNSFLDFIKLKRHDIVGQTINDTLLKIFNEYEDISNGITEALNGRTNIKDISLDINEEKINFIIRIVPTTFHDGSYGVTLIINNTTGYKLVKDALEESEKNFKKLVEKINDK